jgi:hypothetical protein
MYDITTKEKVYIFFCQMSLFILVLLKNRRFLKTWSSLGAARGKAE